MAVVTCVEDAGDEGNETVRGTRVEKERGGPRKPRSDRVVEPREDSKWNGVKDRRTRK